METSTLLLVLDLVGVAVFAAAGASAAVTKWLDLFGVAFVGVVAALGGGLIRDVVIGAVPPLALRDWRYVAVAVVVSTLVCYLHPHLARLRRVILVLDAAGLGLFTVAGTLAAAKQGVPPVGSWIVGMVTGIGGGVGRDILLGEIPVVLRREIYAVAALVGAIGYTVAVQVGLPGPVSAVSAAMVVFAIRMVALWRKWSAPRPRGIVGPDAAAGG